jgi:hypothetical protein
MVRLPAVFTATALTPCRRHKPGPTAEGRLGGVARAAADPLPQLGQFDSQGGELAAVLLNLLLLGRDELSGLGWPQQPISVWNPGRRRAHHSAVSACDATRNQVAEKGSAGPMFAPSRLAP